MTPDWQTATIHPDFTVEVDPQNGGYRRVHSDGSITYDSDIGTPFPSLDFGSKTPRQRGAEAFNRGLMRAEIVDREFFTLMNANSTNTRYTLRELGDHRTAACRAWTTGWDEAQRAAARPPRDSSPEAGDADPVPDTSARARSSWSC